MAKLYEVNVVTDANATTGIFYRLKTLLVSAGWVVRASSDGTTYNSTGDQITSAGTGAGGLSNARAWFRIQDPGGVREFVMQFNGTTNTRVKYSASAKFTGGSPSATVTPSATDEQTIAGGGTDASPTYLASNYASGAYKTHAVARNDAVNGVYYWGVYIVQWPSNVANTVIACDALAAGSYPAEDTDPAMLVWNGACSTVSGHSGWLSYSTASKVWSTTLASSIAGAASLVQYPGTTKDTKLPIYAYSSTNLAVKGFFASIKYAMNSGRSYPSLVDRTTDAYLYIGAYLVPWPNSVDPT